MFRTRSRFGSAPQATTATPAGDAIAAFRLDIPQDRLAFETIQAFAQEKGDAMLLEISGYPRACFRIQITVQQIGVAMHHADFEFQLPQACRRFAGQQPTAHDDDRLLQLRHLPQGQRVSNCPQINDIAQAHTSDRRPDGPTPHREAGLVKFDRLAISQDREPPIDISCVTMAARRVSILCDSYQAGSRCGSFFSGGVLSRRKLFESIQRLYGW